MKSDETELHDQLTAVFREVFADDGLNLRDEMTSQDIVGWDSVTHINLMFGLEQAFGIRFRGNELAELRNIGEVKRVIAARITA